MFVHDWFLRIEFAVVPGLQDNVTLKDGLLLLDESFCVVLVGEAPSICTVESLQALRMCLIPVLSDWEDPLPPCDSRTLRLNSVALRFFTNCSSLWRFRLVILSTFQDHECSLTEPTFLGEIAGFKAFNYHLYNYWLKCVLAASPNADLSLLHLNSLIGQAIKDPSNFSPLHVLLMCFTDGVFHADIFYQACERLITRTPTEAIIEFAVCLCLLPNVPMSLTSQCRSIIPRASLFLDLLD
jgi:hypothetical protein